MAAAETDDLYLSSVQCYVRTCEDGNGPQVEVAKLVDEVAGLREPHENP